MYNFIFFVKVISSNINVNGKNFTKEFMFLEYLRYY